MDAVQAATGSVLGRSTPRRSAIGGGAVCIQAGLARLRSDRSIALESGGADELILRHAIAAGSIHTRDTVHEPDQSGPLPSSRRPG